MQFNSNYKMADQPVVVQPVLCFLIKRFGKSDVNRLKTTALSFYSTDAITSAKGKLTDDVETQKLEDIPHAFVAKRRDSVNKERSVREVDDMLSIIKLLDERKLLDRLPRYVAEDPADLPSLNLVDGDMFVILSKMAQIENAMMQIQFGLNAVHSMVHAFSQSHQQVAIHSQPPMASGVHFTGPSSSSAANNSSLGKPAPSIHLITAALPIPGSSKQSTQRDNATAGPGPAVAESSNRWSALMDAQSGYETSGDELPFSVALSRRTRRAIAHANRQAAGGDKRRHDSGPAPHDSAADNTDNPEGVSTKKVDKKKKRTMIIGTRSTVAVGSLGVEFDSKVIAADPIVRKAVFIVDNVTTGVSPEDIREHAERRGIHVVTVHQVDTRRTPREVREGIDQEALKETRLAFRVCVDREDIDKMFTEKNWDRGVIVDKWKFKPRKDKADASQPDAKTSRGDSISDISGCSSRRRWQQLRRR